MKRLFVFMLVIVALIMIPAGVYATPTVDGNAGLDQVPAKAIQRPLEDFLSTQGTFFFPDGEGGCLLFVPPFENFFGWGDPDIDNCLAISVDYAGLADRAYGTEFSGKVTERPLADGRAEVHVRLRTENALAWVIEGTVITDEETGEEICVIDFANDTVLFGDRWAEGGTTDEAYRALGQSFLHVVFINTAPGAPLPDLIQLANSPVMSGDDPPIPIQQLTFLAFNAKAKGPLREAFGVPDGTPGIATVVQRGLFDISGHGQGVADGFPVENIKLKPIGKN